jgi:hypothetical protein
MTGYGDSFYGAEWYQASPYRVGGSELSVGIRARIVKPIYSSPPVMDTIYRGLAQRFDWLQQGIQAFGLFNKIEYAQGTDLDDHWGRIYDLPRLTSETDYDYRIRLKNYVRVLTGSGTIPATQAVLDSMIGLPGETRIESRWPARACIDFRSVDGMRAARARLSLINSVLPGMFAAGVDYELLLPFLDVLLVAYVQGDAEKTCFIRAAVATDIELSCGIDAIVAINPEMPAYLRAAVQAIRDAYLPIRAAIREDRGLEHAILAAIQGEPYLEISIFAAIRQERDAVAWQKAAIRGEPWVPCSNYAAIARNFEIQAGILARIVHMYELSAGIRAAIRQRRELSSGIRARIARSS